jgi:transposase
MAKAVNFVWNFCNEIQRKAVHDRRFWLRPFDLNTLTFGVSQELNLHSQTIQAICEQYVSSRKQHHRPYLRWRSFKYNPGWIPFKEVGIKLSEDTVVYCRKKFRFWKDREIPSIPKCGSFSQDARGRWYINLVCEYQETIVSKEGSIGIDLGLKSVATLSTGKKFDAQHFFKKYELKLAHHQRCNNGRRVGKSKRHAETVRNIYAKIKNSRKDFNHKVSHELTRDFNKIFIGDVSSTGLLKTKLAKSVSDACWGQLRSFVEYKAIARQGTMKIICEDYTTQTCSSCGAITGPKGKDGLRVREWVCEVCGSKHDRDVNAAVNILNRGLQATEPSPLGASSAFK